jgi:adenosylhomocysteine nucleosidase
MCCLGLDSARRLALLPRKEKEAPVDVADQAFLTLTDGIGGDSAAILTLSRTAAAGELWDLIRRRAKSTRRALGEKEQALLAAQPGQPVEAAALRELLQQIPRYDLRSWLYDLASRTAPPRAARYDVGIITILSEETRAVTAILDSAGQCRQRILPGGLRFCEASILAAGKTVTVAATQALAPGQRPAVLAFGHLWKHYAPATVALVGIAGAISPAVCLGDVVVADRIIYYDLRKELADHVVHRGEAAAVPAVTGRAVNAFFSDHGEPYRAAIPGPDQTERTCHVLRGPIGSGEAVIANKDSEIRQYLLRFNDKTLALETEAGGVVQAFHETDDAASHGTGWLVIRGISDHADIAKDDSYHEIAAWHAADILRQLLPYLKLATALRADKPAGPAVG